MARLVVCSPGVPHESRGASLVLFFHYVARLRREGHEILHVLLLEGDAWPEDAVAAYRERLGLEIFPCRAAGFLEQRRSGPSLRTDLLAPAVGRVAAYRPDALVCFDLLAAWA